MKSKKPMSAMAVIKKRQIIGKHALIKTEKIEESGIIKEYNSNNDTYVVDCSYCFIDGVKENQMIIGAHRVSDNGDELN